MLSVAASGLSLSLELVLEILEVGADEDVESGPKTASFVPVFEEVIEAGFEIVVVGA